MCFVDILVGLLWGGWSGCFGVDVLFFMGKLMHTNISALITSKNMQCCLRILVSVIVNCQRVVV